MLHTKVKVGGPAECLTPKVVLKMVIYIAHYLGHYRYDIGYNPLTTNHYKQLVNSQGPIVHTVQINVICKISLLDQNLMLTVLIYPVRIHNQ